MGQRKPIPLNVKDPNKTLASLLRAVFIVQQEMRAVKRREKAMKDELNGLKHTVQVLKYSGDA